MEQETTGCHPEQLLAAHRPEIEAAMAQHFAGPQSVDASPADLQASAELVGLLIDVTGSESGTPSVDHRGADRHYQTQFGDALTAVLRDVLGEAADPPFLARCIDGFWRAVRAQEPSL